MTDAKYIGSDSLLVCGFRIYFTPLIGVLFTFPSRYLFAIDHQKYLALEDSAPRFKRNFSGSVLLENNYYRGILFSRTGLLPSLVFLSKNILLTKHSLP